MFRATERGLRTRGPSTTVRWNAASRQLYELTLRRVLLAKKVRQFVSAVSVIISSSGTNGTRTMGAEKRNKHLWYLNGR